MAKYKTEKRKANVGERILITGAEATRGRYLNGSVATVRKHSFEETSLYVNEWAGVVWDSEYEVIVEAKPSKSERISLLESQVAELTAKVEALEKAKTKSLGVAESAVDVGKRITEAFINGMRSAENPKSTPNEQRKDVIEKAREFVAEHTKKYGEAWHSKGVSFGPYVCDVQFIVNVDKRVVTILGKGVNSGKVRVRTIAKCAPDDVFNADIGKAIALGRALGLDVSEFENAVKPTEFAKGQVITYDRRKQIITEIDGDKARINKDDFHWTFRINEREYVIIDDTDAKY